MKVSANIKATLGELWIAKDANTRDRKQVMGMAGRWARIILLLSLGAALHLQCKTANTEPEPPIQPPPDLSFQGIGDLPGGRVHSEALGVSDDGTVIIGRSSSARFEEEGFFRTVGDSLTVLQGPAGAPVSSEPRALTPNGEIIAGKTTSARGLEAARWTAATGWVGLGDLAGGMFGSQALGISADGRIIVGNGTTSSGQAEGWIVALP